MRFRPWLKILSVMTFDLVISLYGLIVGISGGFLYSFYYGNVNGILDIAVMLRIFLMSVIVLMYCCRFLRS